jgi:hypothetical protein
LPTILSKPHWGEDDEKGLEGTDVDCDRKARKSPHGSLGTSLAIASRNEVYADDYWSSYRTGLGIFFEREEAYCWEDQGLVIVAEAECQEYSKGERLKVIRFDRGKEFLNEAMKVFCEGRAIRIEPTVGYHPEGDGIAERSMRTISHRRAAMRHEMDLPPAYLEFANATAAYLRNRGVQ